ncbi:MAG TPA: sigma factor-like helix-turn-helix DNA-binding protein [Roseiarcus sp.]|nr:sigma factor-like helix-turn-helix DNA-binding protein [Roseiarcus sp.]
MTDEPAERAEARARGKTRRTTGFERREAIFDLFLSGFSHHEIAKALGTSPGAVRRIVDRAVAARRLGRARAMSACRSRAS